MGRLAHLQGARLNFYKHHLGDYAAATSHLSWDEDCAYRRLIDQYYKRETPIPVDVKEACRLVRAATPSQRRAVEAVLREFFRLNPDGWHQNRCNEEIGFANAQAETNRRIAEERESKKRARKEHESLHAPLNEPSTNRSPAPTESVNLARLQTPDTRLQTPEIQGAQPDVTTSRALVEGEVEPENPAEGAGTRYGLAAKAMRQRGCAANPGDPRLRTLVDQGASIEEFEALGAEAADKGKGPAWALTALVNRRQEAADTRLAPQAAAPPWHESRDGVSARAQQLGMQAWPDFTNDAIRKGTTPSWSAYRNQVIMAAADKGTTR